MGFMLSSCAVDSWSADKDASLSGMRRPEQQVIRITSFGTKPSFLNAKNSNFNQKSKIIILSDQNRKGKDDDILNTAEFEASESVVLSNLIRYIYPGSLLMGNSIQELNFKPVVVPLNPVTVSLSIPAMNKQTEITINNPSLSGTRAAINNYLQTADFTQNGEFSYSVEQFSTYDELKVAFGSNVNTSSIFHKTSSSTNIENSMIRKATGFYVKFTQKSFTLDMDIPKGDLVKNYNFNTNGVEPVYVSSISYGRMGILTIETDETSETAKKIINESLEILFFKKEKTLTEEQKSFLKKSDFNIYLIGGDGETAVQAFQGYEAFINHVSQKSFSKSEPGVPIFCSYSYFKDHSPVKTRFVYNTRVEPVYVRLLTENMDVKQGDQSYNQDNMLVYGDVVLRFYKNKGGTVPTVANSKIKFRLLLQDLIKLEQMKDTYPSEYLDEYGDKYFINNELQEKSIKWITNTFLTEYTINNNPRVYYRNMKYKILKDPDYNYFVID